MTNIDDKFNVCDISNYIKSVKGLKSNSSSPSDTWIVDFKDDVTYNYKPISKGFLKIFIEPEDLDTTHKTPDKLALKYELNIYKYVIDKVIKYKICPNFVKYFSCGENCSYENLFNILKHLSTDIKVDDIISKLNRNLYYIYKQKKDRPSIESNEILPLLRPVYFNKLSLRYNIILIENIDDAMTLHKWLYTYNKNPDYNRELWNILFQISVACYTMSLCKLVHNDLHSSNIFIKDLGKETDFMYIINDHKIIIKTRFQPLIYDFDRGYTKKFGTNPLLNNLCTKYSQCNMFVENKDIIKVLCYVYKSANTLIKDNIINIISSDRSYQKRLKDSYDLISSENGLKQCFLQHVDELDNKEKSFSASWYQMFNNSFNILMYISSYLPKYSPDDINKNNIFTCNKNFFDSEGNLIIDGVADDIKDDITKGDFDIWKNVHTNLENAVKSCTELNKKDCEKYIITALENLGKLDDKKVKKDTGKTKKKSPKKSPRMYKYSVLVYYFRKPSIKNTKNVNIVESHIKTDGYLGSDIIYVLEGDFKSNNKKNLDTYLKCAGDVKTIVEIKRK